LDFYIFLEPCATHPLAQPFKLLPPGESRTPGAREPRTILYYNHLSKAKGELSEAPHR